MMNVAVYYTFTVGYIKECAGNDHVIKKYIAYVIYVRIKNLSAI